VSIYKRRAPGRHRAIGEAIGAVLVLVLLIVAAAALTFSIVYMYGALGATHSAQVTAGQPTKENLSMVYVAHIPPDGAPGVVVTNYGIPTTIVEVLQVVGNNVVAQPTNVPLATGSSATIPLQSGAFALVTNTGAIFSYNMGNASSVSLVSIGAQTNPSPGLYYVSGGVTISSASHTEWVVNGTTESEGTQLNLDVDGPTTVVALATAPVTFEAQGLGSDAQGMALIVTVNNQSATYAANQLPVTLYLLPGTQVFYSWASPISGSSGVQYVWQSTSGLDNGQSGTFTVPAQGGSVVATYGTQYYLTVQASPAAGGSVSPASGWYNAGTQVQISATANSGYQFYGWVGSGSGSYTGSSSSATITMNGPITETAYFQILITFSANGLGSDAQGTILTVNGQSYGYSNLPVTVAVSYGSTVSYSWSSPVSAGTGKRYVWQSTSGLASSQSGSFTATQPGSVTASYATQYLLTMAASPSQGGTTSPAPGSYWYYAGTQVQISATANSGYQFNGWSGSGSGSYSGTSNPATITMDGPITETAVFYVQVTFSTTGMGSDAQGTVLTVDGSAYTIGQLPITFVWPYGSQHSFSWSSPVSAGSGKQYVWQSTSGLSNSQSGTLTVSGPGSVVGNYATQYLLTMQVSPSGAGTTNPAPGSYWEAAGAQIQISVTVNSGYQFYGWIGSGSGSYTGSSSSATITMNGPITETASFYVQVTFSAQGLGSGASGTVLTVDGQSYSYSQLPVTFSWPTGSQHSFAWSSPVPGSSGVQYVWQSTSGLATAQSGTLTVSGPGSVVATYGTQYYLTMTANPPSGGSVSPGSGWYNAGSSVQISASANSGWAFSSWSGSGSGSYSGTGNPTTITMNGPVTETANFYAGVTLSATQGGSASASWSGGSASVGAGQSTTFYVAPGTSVQFTATPTSSQFAGWVGSGSGSYTGANNPVSVTVNNPISEQATFSIQVTFSANGLSSSAQGTVLTVDGTGYSYSQLPVTFTWAYGSQHSFTWTSPVPAGTGTQYAWQSTSGLSSAQSGTLTATQSGSVTATYVTQYLVTAVPSYYQEYIWALQNGQVVGPYTGSAWLDAGSQVYVTSQFAIYNGQYMSSGVLTSFSLSDQYLDYGGQTYGGYPDWPFNSPQGNFVVQFYGAFIAPYTGTYTFATTSDDGSALWISTSPQFTPSTATLVVNNWYQQGATTRTGTISLTAGQVYYIMVDYEQGNGGYMLNLQWQPPGTSSLSEMPVWGTAWVYAAPFVSSSTSTAYSPGASGNPSTEQFYDPAFWSTTNLNGPATVGPTWSTIQFTPPTPVFLNTAGVSSNAQWTAVFGGSAWVSQGATYYSKTVSVTPGYYLVVVDWVNQGGPGVSAISISGASMVSYGWEVETWQYKTSGMPPYSDLNPTFPLQPTGFPDGDFALLGYGTFPQMNYDYGTPSYQGNVYLGMTCVPFPSTVNGSAQLNNNNPSQSPGYTAVGIFYFQSSVTFQIETDDGMEVFYAPVSGSVSPATGAFAKGEQVALSASPPSGMYFSRWVGIGSSSYTGTTANPTVTLNANTTEIAVFSPPYYLTAAGVLSSWTPVFGGSAWKSQGATYYSKTVTVAPGYYAVVVDWVNQGGPGVSAISISGATMASQGWNVEVWQYYTSGMPPYSDLDPGNPLVITGVLNNQFQILGYGTFTGASYDYGTASYQGYTYLGMTCVPFPSSVGGSAQLNNNGPSQSPGYTAVGIFYFQSSVTFQIETDDGMEVFYAPVAGSVSPSSGPYAPNSQISMSESPPSGSQFVAWAGIGPGAYYGVSTNPTLALSGNTTEVAEFTYTQNGVQYFGGQSYQGSALVIASGNPALPVLVTNTQSAADPAPFQVPVSWNPSSFSPFESSSLGNVRFVFPGGGLANAWLQTSSATSSSASATAWVKLPNGLPAGGSSLLYMEFYPTTTGFDGNYWGAAGTSTDNGQTVFNAYADFQAGKGYGWSWGGNTNPYFDSNGLVLVDWQYGAGEWLAPPNNIPEVPTILEVGWAYSGDADALAASLFGNNANTFPAGVVGGTVGGGTPASTDSTYAQYEFYTSQQWLKSSYTNSILASGSFTGHQWLGSYNYVTSYIIVTGNWAQSGWVETTNSEPYPVTALSSVPLGQNAISANLNYNPYQYPQMLIGAGSGGLQSYVAAQWAVARTYPPNGAMPVVAVG